MGKMSWKRGVRNSKKARGEDGVMTVWVGSCLSNRVLKPGIGKMSLDIISRRGGQPIFLLFPRFNRVQASKDENPARRGEDGA